MTSLRISSRKRWIACLCAVGLLLTAGCSKKPAGKRYELEGRVVAVDTASRILTVDHGEVAGLMPAMTMPFQVSRNDDWIFDKIGPGDHIHATLVMTDHAELQDISFTKASDAGSDGTSNLRVPEPGDDVPNFTLVNQFGKTIHLDQFRGKPLLLTFIYTRCPLPDFCPRLSSNFAEVLGQLQKSPKAFESAQLLSISIDPEYDKPSVLHSYGKPYLGNVDPGFRHWQFATGSPEEVRKTADFFGLSHNEKQGQIVHTLQTVLIGADGKIVRVYAGNQWKPADAAADYAAAAGSH